MHVDDISKAWEQTGKFYGAAFLLCDLDLSAGMSLEQVTFSGERFSYLYKTGVSWPTPEKLTAYEYIYPGFVEKVLTFAEKGQDYMFEQERRVWEEKCKHIN